MTNTFKDLLLEATRLSREGRVAEATALIQRALHLTRATADPGDRPSRSDRPREVIEGDFETLEPAGPGGSRCVSGRYSGADGALDYRLYVPPPSAGRAKALGEGWGLILMLHGCQQDAADFASLTRMDRIAGDVGFLVLYPSQSRESNATGCWNWFLPEHQRADQGEPALLAGLTRQIMARHGVDPRRVYVAGLSAGGAMAMTMAATYPELFAAVGVHSGLPHAAAQDTLSAMTLKGSGASVLGGQMPSSIGSGMPVIVFQGDADPKVHPVNATRIIDQVLAGADSATAERLGVRATREEGRVQGGHAYTRTCYLGARGSSKAELWIVHGGGHGWFGGSPEGSFAEPLGPDASREMVRFFLECPKR